MLGFFLVVSKNFCEFWDGKSVLELVVCLGKRLYDNSSKVLQSGPGREMKINLFGINKIGIFVYCKTKTHTNEKVRT
jgi:hypothetical protein